MGIVGVTIKNEQQIADDSIQVIAIDISTEFNKVPVAVLKLIDGNFAKEEFKILDGGFFEPGRKIELTLKNGGLSKTEQMTFVGIVVHQSLAFNRHDPTLTVELSDIAIKMTSTRKNTVYSNQKDSAIIKELIKQNGLRPSTIEPTKMTHDQMVQYYSSDWDFMLSRAEANAQFVSVSNGAITVKKPAIESPALVVELSSAEVYDYDLQLDGDKQYDTVSSVAWDMNAQKLTKPVKGKDYALEQGKYDVGSIAQAVGAGTTTLVQAIPMPIDELQSWSDTQILKSRLSLLRGWIKILGTAKAEVGKTIEIKGAGKHFTGKNIITGVRHEYAKNGWITHLQIGMDACWFSAKKDITETRAAGLLPGIHGLQLGIVTAMEKDPDNQFRIRVHIPAFGSGQDTIWARLAAMDAGKDHGTFFIPQPNDQVIVGFLNDDPRHAVVLGALYHPKSTPPLDINKQNTSKGIFTQSGYQILLDELQERITIATSAKNRIVIDQKEERIELADSHGNQLGLSKNGIVINSVKDCEILTDGNLNIQAKGGIEIKGKKVDVI